MAVYTKEEVDQLIQAAIAPVLKRLIIIEYSLPKWIPLGQAIELTGCNSAWFYTHRTNGTLPIEMLPKANISERDLYSRLECIAYGIENGNLPLDYESQPTD